MLKCRYYSVCDYGHQCDGCLFNPEEDREIRSKAKNGSITDMRLYKREKMREYRARNLREEFPFLEF